MRIFGNNPLFGNMSEEEVEEALVVLDAKGKMYKSGEIIHLQGERLKQVGIVLSGKMQMERVELSGKINLITFFDEGEMFGEVYVFANMGETTFSLVASEDTEIMFLDFGKVFTKEERSAVANILIFNLLGIVSSKALFLNGKLEIVSKSSTREKLMAFFERESVYQKSRIIKSPISKTELASYLGVDRSAMQRELTRMKEEGLLDFDKNVYKIRVN